uniref:Uncharacterized protein n=1 Tax=Virus NIOZ-UU157 TaxID=2763269 RepID=A0A7S9XG12_9VIRU|nr:MAG: hypothetical protein NIOZUU157_00050 [Virus NIOZ-UU157]
MKVEEFKDRVRHDNASEMDNAPYKEASELGDLNNPKYNWIQVGHSKYGRYMYCTNTKVRRGQTMGEFYGGGIVD